MMQSPRERLTRTSMSLAILAIFSTLTLPVLLPYIFGSVSIMLAIISKGARHSFPRRSRTAVIRVFDTPNPRKALAALFFWSNSDSLLFLNS